MLPTAALAAAATGWGMFVRARRQLLCTLRDRAERAESEQLVRAERARLAERTRIAREMHDVLAHRISQVALHAGALRWPSTCLPPRCGRAQRCCG
jgi:signal transduction histidine kinase